RFAVCWNGLVYPVFRLGEPADLKADVLKAIDADAAVRKGQGGDHLSQMYRTFDPTSAIPEAAAVSHETVLPLKACLLLRLGQEELARRLWKAWEAGLEKVNN